ncbi:TIGR03667 family PPOX class F420-dependent oxidoreductase [Kribbella sp. CA-293567]|uniref:TIGR03667 family PPOX class F420-dependent oxidoreductase n=1 Tax=Kribbella sp. CA-293567 TaxID=3002436 RepID=UPI0022DD18EA|nr:TIGR03667 family PPOX class F420-dependent oxidoreductase [Kribbella sp. CA-293567]WBQ02009.1 TIGR03667 family PPOX class F420-dependent oxidoreductase [Kribbella sp. CA-293567]
MFTIDTSTDFGARIERQLRDEQVVWLTTVGRSGTPQPNPVWFGWNGDELLVFSQAGKAKVHNVANQPRVSLNFNATFTGGDIGVITGDATLDGPPATAEELAAYDAKYAEGLASLDMSAETFHRDYPTLIRIKPDNLRGF